MKLTDKKVDSGTQEYIQDKRRKMMVYARTQCLLCNGVGMIEARKFAPTDKILREKAIKLLLDSNYGIRQIQRILGYKSPRSVQVIVERLGKTKIDKRPKKNT